ncbi:MAG TPA: histone deacetylase [Gemmatimonadales bacterium]|nr:histone deacetylase [Gemmatimonadales bacterium]
MSPPGVFSHHACLEHDPGRGHPESPARLAVLLDRLAGEGIPVEWSEPARLEAILRVHPREYLDLLARVAEQGGGPIEADTVLNPASWEAALGAAGAALAAVTRAHDTGSAFAAIRPPGHHALRAHAMGFCLLANAVIAGRHAQSLGRSRILIVDWDVHHGNGTQALVETEPDIRFVSLHEWPAYPGTGSELERGIGNVFNVPRPAGLPPERYVRDLLGAVRRASEGWSPDLVIISAGYDSMAGDPLGGFTLEPEHYGQLVDGIRERCPDAPVAVVLEGGYAPSRVADGVVATLKALE